jgi:hypothetical protein
MQTLTKCRLVMALSFLVATPGTFAIVAMGLPVWFLFVMFATFWPAGMFFVIAMIGDGKEGLGLKDD